MRRAGSVLVVVSAVLLAACQFPRDPEGTLDRVQGGTLRAGVVHHPPWGDTTGSQPAGVEVELLERFAAELDARIEWVTGPEGDLITALEEGTLDVLVGGLTVKTPGLEAVGVTRPYHESTLVVGFPPGMPAPEDLEGIRVAVERGTEAEALVEDSGAIPVPVGEVEDGDRPAAVEDFRLGDLGLTDAGFHLATHQHVVAVRPGENAWLVRLEGFLDAHRAQAARLVEEAG